MFGTLGWEELLIILVILALLFGASRVADLGGALGRGIREFRSEAGGSKQDSKTTAANQPASNAPAANAPMTAEQRSSLDALTKLKDDGVITAEEYESKKADLLAKG